MENDVYRKFIEEIIQAEYSEVLVLIKDLAGSCEELGDRSLNNELKLLEFSFLEPLKIDSNDDRLKSIIEVSNADAQLDIIQSKVEQAAISTQKSKGFLQKIFGAIFSVKNFLKSLVTHLWQYLTKMATLTHWSVSGGVGFKVPLLFSGNITLQLTFGK